MDNIHVRSRRLALLQISRKDFALGLVTWEWMKPVAWVTVVPYYLWIQIASQSEPWAWHVHSDGICCWMTPYGLPWYGLFRILTSFGWPIFGLLLTVMDGIVLWTIARATHPLFSLVFFVSSMWFFIYSPIDLPVFWLGALSVKNPVFSIGALLVKLPLGAPAYVWNYVGSASLGYLWQANYLRYGLLGIWIVGPILYWSRRRVRRALRWVVKPWIELRQDHFRLEPTLTSESGNFNILLMTPSKFNLAGETVSSEDSRLLIRID